ncbi:hypothetical protein [Halarchaeum nitratireducens]|uniref:hypothetical protein n=1 Tax=Halarchaeum nitratireducens TaxID=489913 RepID=UPI00166C1AB3|nr:MULTISPECIES: hypothetical protein [Halarchaeum]MBP2251109.1 hypothetical protein [Halarchaeum solikamskense]
MTSEKTGREGSTWYRSSCYGSYVLAICILIVAALVVGLLDPPPAVATAVRVLITELTLNNQAVTTVLFVGLPLVLAGTVYLRAVSVRTPTIILAAFATPCLLVAGWATYSRVATTPGVAWSGVLTLAVGTLLAVIVLTDAVLERLAAPSRWH